MKQLFSCVFAVLAFTSCNSTSTPADYTLKLEGSGGVGICWTEPGLERETMCEAEGVSIPGRPSSGPRTGIQLPTTATQVSKKNLYFTVELVTASEVKASMYKNGNLCSNTVLKGQGQKLRVQC
ncbi:hypothetical protein [Deinococcus radiophilus]|uniref:Lipoprotein n=1 Tax=Deinococcus radiophilus TaxID=32062 RepID=A0A431VWW4_9DEIO|nr:hypothetical protein [Deinococcus radiophilus]RTR27489.1 hypothetical protein EJ104_06400 [Deinococcus radiophilus]UFA50353.1 hypothetical protein LMT64_00035 [Deinococcus radiophilus]